MERTSCVVLFRRDLRLSDHAALAAALERGYDVVPVYVHEEAGPWGVGSAQRWWLHYALRDLEKEIELLGGNLSVLEVNERGLQGALIELMEQLQSSHVFWGRRYGPHDIAADSELKEVLKTQGYQVESFNTRLLNEPMGIWNLSGSAYQVFTPYYKSVLTREKPRVLDYAVEELCWSSFPGLGSVDSLSLLPNLDWADGFGQHWDPSRQGAVKLLQAFKPMQYLDQRDKMALPGTSRMSPYLALGQLSPSEVWSHVGESGEEYRRQLVWREFSYYTLFHFPHSAQKALKPQWQVFPWQYDESVMGAWQSGRTGIPIVDAGMRELWETGWMHNRVRMVVASVLVKYLQQDWMAGAQWFWDTLLDADLANNSMGWQWSAGCGADAAPYFRVMNPVLQSQKFDSKGEYLRRWLPELSEVPDKYVHAPWEMPELLALQYLSADSIYLNPIVTPKQGRSAALSALEQFKAMKS